MRDKVAEDEKKQQETRKKIDNMLAEMSIPYDHIELSINAKCQVTGKVKLHFDGQNPENKKHKWIEATQIIDNIRRINNPKEEDT